MNGDRAILHRMMATLVIAAVGLAAAAWLGIGSITGVLETLVEERRTTTSRLTTLERSQEAYRRSLQQDRARIDPRAGSIDALFLDDSDLLVFVVTVEELANRVGVVHSIAAVPEESAQGQQKSDRLGAASAERVVTIDLMGSFPAAAQFMGALEQSLPLVSVRSFRINRQRTTPGSESVAAPSLKGGATPVVVTMTVSVAANDEAVRR